MKLWYLLLFISFYTNAQLQTKYEPSAENPYGLPNPNAPDEIKDFAPMIGTCNCTSTSRNPDQSWAKPQKMTWTFSYIMNGMAVQDETLKEDGAHSGSIRQYIADSSKWYVHYYSNKSPSTVLPAWEGGKRGDSIVLYRPQKAPNGMDGFYRITFKDFSGKGYNWLGEWVNKTETFAFPTWKIECQRPPLSDKEIILKNTANFSNAYMQEDAKAIANLYTNDGSIFPSNSPIISGKEAIKKRWTITNGTDILYHKVTPSEIKISNDYAYDFGHYEGKLRTKDNKESEFKGKYVIVWKKVNDDWKIHLDIWNSL